MDILLDGISKRYTSTWVIKDLQLSIGSGQKWAIKGKNGSGKSTLIQLISGVLAPSIGKISYHFDRKVIRHDDIFKWLSIHTAYTELDEELTALELFEHFKIFNPGQIIDNEEFMSFSELSKERHRHIKAFSSGMKQRLALAMVINSTRPLLLLDEPGSFLDDYWKGWLTDRLKSHAAQKTIIIASNDAEDLRICDHEYGLN
jgi:ABC-type multidrug transport system ATPase subunit